MSYLVNDNRLWQYNTLFINLILYLIPLYYLLAQWFEALICAVKLTPLPPVSKHLLFADQTITWFSIFIHLFQFLIAQILLVWCGLYTGLYFRPLKTGYHCFLQSYYSTLHYPNVDACTHSVPIFLLLLWSEKYSTIYKPSSMTANFIFFMCIQISFSSLVVVLELFWTQQRG